jgi:hypothetical protein
MEKIKYTNYTGEVFYTASDNKMYKIEVNNATFSISSNGFIGWEDGLFIDGVFFKGYWKKGTWYNGYWKNGNFISGSWYDGIWKMGAFGNLIDKNNIPIWYNGTWHNGVWHNGIWHNGIWEKGTCYCKGKKIPYPNF